MKMMADEKEMERPEENEDSVVLVDEEGIEYTFTIIDVIQVEGRDYVILLPEEDEVDEAVILRLDTDVNGEDILVDIEDEEEWDRVVQAWEEILEEEYGKDDEED